MVALTISDRTIVILEVGSSGRSVSLVERGRLSWRSLHDRVCLPGAEPASPNRLSDSNSRPVPAGGKKERNAARHVRFDLGVQRLEVYLEQRPKQHGHKDEIKEEPRRRCEALLQINP